MRNIINKVAATPREAAATNIINGGEHTTGRPQGATSIGTRLPWGKLHYGVHLARIVDMTPAQAGRYFRKLLVACLAGERGVMPEADEILEESERYYFQKREAGRRGGLATQRFHSSGAPSNASSSAQAIQTNKHTNIQTEKQRESQEDAGAEALSQFSIPSWEEMKNFGADEGYPLERVQKCFEHYRRSGWKDTEGQPIRNWKAKLSSWMNRPELVQPDTTPAPISPEETRRKEAAERRARIIRESAEKIVAMQSWVDSGGKCPFCEDPLAEMDQVRQRIETHYGQDGLNELNKAVAQVTEEKRLEDARYKARTSP